MSSRAVREKRSVELPFSLCAHANTAVQPRSSAHAVRSQPERVYTQHVLEARQRNDNGVSERMLATNIQRAESERNGQIHKHKQNRTAERAGLGRRVGNKTSALREMRTEQSEWQDARI